MAKLTRVTGKVFGSQASPTGDVDNGAYIGQFGSAQAGTYVGTDDVAMIQNLPAWEQGWIGACVEEDQLPPLPERTGVDKVLSYQECYLLQQGMPEWDSATTYYIDNFCSYNGVIYKSLTDINLNNQPDTSVANWEVYGKISQYTKFAINKGNENLLVNNSNELAFDVDNSNPLTYTNIMGETRTVDSLLPIDISAENDGTYKVALPQSGNQPYLFNGTVYNQETEPTTQVQDDIWINPQEPYTAKQYDGADWQDFNDVLLLDSSVIVASGVINTLKQPSYNYNAINLNQSSSGNIQFIQDVNMVDFSAYITLPTTLNIIQIADDDIVLFAGVGGGYFRMVLCTSTGTEIAQLFSIANGNTTYPIYNWSPVIKKGQYFKVTSVGSTTGIYKFYLAK